MQNNEDFSSDFPNSQADKKDIINNKDYSNSNNENNNNYIKKGKINKKNVSFNNQVQVVKIESYKNYNKSLNFQLNYFNLMKDIVDENERKKNLIKHEKQYSNLVLEKEKKLSAYYCIIL